MFIGLNLKSVAYNSSVVRRSQNYLLSSQPYLPQGFFAWEEQQRADFRWKISAQKS